jgi:hypothetical protein
MTDAIIDLASAMLGVDFRASGRTLARLGLAGRDLEGVRAFVAAGAGGGAHLRSRRQGVPA